MATTTRPPNTEKTPEWNAERLDDLLARVERLEKSLYSLMTGRVAEISQEEKDRRTLSRLPNSYQEAVEHEAAQKRQAERDKASGRESGTENKGSA